MMYTAEQIIEALKIRMPHDALCRAAYDLIMQLLQRENTYNET